MLWRQVWAKHVGRENKKHHRSVVLGLGLGPSGVYCPWHTSPSEFGGLGHTLVLASLRGAYFHHLAELLAAAGLGLDQLEP